MKTTLYALFSHKEWEWHISLHFDTDRRYWQAHHKGHHSVICLSLELSFGQALSLQQRLNKMGGWAINDEEAIRRAVDSGYFNEFSEALIRNMSWMSISSGYAADDLKWDGIDLSQWESMLVLLGGRMLLTEEIIRLLQDHHLDKAASAWNSYIQYSYLRGQIQWTNGISTINRRRFPYLWTSRESSCVRCGSNRLHWTHCDRCQAQCPYCEDCLTMGRVRYCSLLIQTITEAPAEPDSIRSDSRLAVSASATSEIAPMNLPEDHLEKWGLSPAQRAASSAGIQFLRDSTSDCFLIWAVTGAGKTEMIFPLIEFEVLRKGKVCVATPRRDVVLELRPRIIKAFPNQIVVTLYGGSDQRWEQGDVTIATTHQLLRFRHCFDLVIIDELDAYPFINNPQLEYAADHARKPNGRYIFLSATPPAHLQKKAANSRLPHVKVPVRYHRHPLPIPQLLTINPPGQWLQTGRIPQLLLSQLEQSLQRGAQCFIFVPAIKWVDPLVQILAHAYPDVIVAGTSSKDPERTGKVQAFRDGGIRLLVTTTILERGVTVPKTDVFILDAGSAMFDEAALVQMSGRAGRSKDDPHGRVYFAAAEKTKSQAKAIKQIETMNRLAARHGYLIEH